MGSWRVGQGLVTEQQQQDEKVGQTLDPVLAPGCGTRVSTSPRQNGCHRVSPKKGQLWAGLSQRAGGCGWVHWPLKGSGWDPTAPTSVLLSLLIWTRETLAHSPQFSVTEMASLLSFLYFGWKKQPLTSQNSLRHAGLIDSTETVFYYIKTPLVPRTDDTSQEERGPCLWSSFRWFQWPWTALIHPSLQEEVQNRQGPGHSKSPSITSLPCFPPQHPQYPAMPTAHFPF